MRWDCSGSKRFIPDRIVERIDVHHESGCWFYTLKWNTGDGYSLIRWKGKTALVHRLLYTFVVGEIDDHLVLDHLCKNRGCCNPDHLEPVTVFENTVRGDLPEKSDAWKDYKPKNGNPWAIPKPKRIKL